MSASVDIEAKDAIWDLDGTLIDSLGIFTEVLCDVLPGHGFNDRPGAQIFSENRHGSLAESINNIIGGNVSEATIEAIIADFLIAQNEHFEDIERHIFPDAKRLAQRLYAADVFQIMVTNRFHEGRLNASPRSIVQRSSLRGRIDAVVCGDDSSFRKPDPKVVNRYLESGMLSGERSLVIGDQFVDAQFARNLGARAILVSRDGSPIPHIEKLGKDWSDYVTIVQSLDQVKI